MVLEDGLANRLGLVELGTTVRPGIGFHTPADVHDGRAAAVRQQRAVVLDAAYAEHPGRFVRKPPQPPALPTTAWINEPQ